MPGSMVLARVERGLGECVRVGLGECVLCRVCREPCRENNNNNNYNNNNNNNNNEEDTPVLVSFDPEERVTEEVALGQLAGLSAVQEAALVAAASGDLGALADPVQNIFQAFRDGSLAPNLEAVAAAGLEEVVPQAKTAALLRGETAGVWDVKALEYLARFLRMDITDEEIMDNYARGIDSGWASLRTGLLAAAEAHRVAFHVLVAQKCLDGLRALDVCSMVRTALAEKAAEVERLLAETKAARDAVLDGSAKQEIVAEYLAAVKKGVNGYLAAHGYDFKVVPPNYTEAPPADMERVITNAAACRSAAASTEFRQIVRIICDAAYIKVDAWASNAAAVLARKFDLRDASPDVAPQTVFAEARPAVEALAKEKPDSKTTRRYVDLLKDADYFAAMKAADAPGFEGSQQNQQNQQKQGQGEAGEYVVSIHIAAKNRLMLYEEECMTVVDIWGTKEQKKRAVIVGTDKEVRRIPESELRITANTPSSPDKVIDMTLPPSASKILSTKAPGVV